MLIEKNLRMVFLLSVCILLRSLTPNYCAVDLWRNITLRLGGQAEDLCNCCTRRFISNLAASTDRRIERDLALRLGFLRAAVLVGSAFSPCLRLVFIGCTAFSPQEPDCAAAEEGQFAGSASPKTALSLGWRAPLLQIEAM